MRLNKRYGRKERYLTIWIGINEEQRQGQRAKYRMEFNISVVARTNKDSTFTLLDLTRSIRELFTTGQRFTPEARNTTFSATQFDIAPGNAHLSFADLQLQIEVVLYYQSNAICCSVASSTISSTALLVAFR